MKKTAFFVALLLLLSVFVPITVSAMSDVASALLSAQADASNTAPVSPALAIIADDAMMAKSGLVGSSLVFSHEDFCRALNLSSLGSITVTALPDKAVGQLLLGTTAVTVGQTISRTNLDALVFSPAADVKCSTSFDFLVGDNGYSMKCSLYMLDKINTTPVIASSVGVKLEIDTYSNTAAFGRLSAYDAENDDLTFEIVSSPKNGLLIMTDASDGSYTYLPRKDFFGKDSFKYVVVDKYGNYSSSASVSVNIIASSGDIVFSDMGLNAANNAALTLAKAGIMSGVTVENSLCFDPSGTVSRSDLVVMAMKAAGISSLPDVKEAGFFDDAQISSDVLPYIAAAKQLGYVSGSENADGKLCFYPNEEITRAEAALIVDRIINGSSLLINVLEKPVFSDAQDIPVWAESSIKNLNLLGLLHDDKNSEINASDKLTRADAAIMLAAVMKLK